MDNLKPIIELLIPLQKATNAGWRVEVYLNDRVGFSLNFYCFDAESKYWGKELHGEKDYQQFMEEL